MLATRGDNVPDVADDEEIARLGTTRLSEQATKSASGACPSASRAKVEAYSGRLLRRKSTIP
jgi:hypothetical protein